MDLDIDMDDAADAGHEPIMEDIPRGEDILQPDEPEELGEVIETEEPSAADDDSKKLIPNKIHIRGLDTLHTDDIKAYVKSHFGTVDRVEWIDDSSANLVFGSELSARDALTALTPIEIADVSALSVGETLPGKPLDGRPEISLHVRFAVEGDRKQAGAALRSRYYLLHPEHDPEERRRQQMQNRSRYRDRDYDRRRRRRNDDRDEDANGIRFDASMYDDVPRSARESRRSRSASGDRSSRSRALENKGKELFADYRRGTGRGRSASPIRDRDNDGDASMSDGRLGASSAGNRVRARSLKDRISSSGGRVNQSKELFPTKASVITARGGGGQLDQLERAIGSARLKEEDRPKVVEVPASSSTGRNSASGFNIRGAATQRSDSTGFTIKGAASAKELFPDRFGNSESNAGKELLGNKRANRQRAEDLFG